MSTPYNLDAGCRIEVLRKVVSWDARSVLCKCIHLSLVKTQVGVFSYHSVDRGTSPQIEDFGGNLPTNSSCNCFLKTCYVFSPFLSIVDPKLQVLEVLAS